MQVEWVGGICCSAYGVQCLRTKGRGGWVRWKPRQHASKKIFLTSETESALARTKGKNKNPAGKKDRHIRKEPTMKTAKTIIASLALAATLAAPVAMAAAPATAHALTPNDCALATSYANAHYEGEKVTIGDDWGQPVYAEWHRGSSGKWWATFWTYNYTKVYATPAPAGCGWVFYCYDANGNFTQIIRCEESSTYGQVGPQGVSSHWQELNGSRWF